MVSGHLVGGHWSVVVREHGPPGRNHLPCGGSRRNPKLPHSHRQTGLLPWELHHASTNSVPVRFSQSLASSAHQGAVGSAVPGPWRAENTAKKKKTKKTAFEKYLYRPKEIRVLSVSFANMERAGGSIPPSSRYDDGQSSSPIGAVV